MLVAAAIFVNKVMSLAISGFELYSGHWPDEPGLCVCVCVRVFVCLEGGQ